MIRLVKGRGLVADCQAGRTVGYRQALEFLEAAWGFPSCGPPYQLIVRTRPNNVTLLTHTLPAVGPKGATEETVSRLPLQLSSQD